MIPVKDKQYYQFCAYGFLKNLRFFDPFLLLFFLSKGFNYFDIGLLYAIREMGFVLTEIPSGIFADAFGRKKSLAYSYIAYLISFLVFYWGQTFWMLAAAMLIFSFGESFRSGTHKALIFDYLEQKSWLKHKTAYYGSTRACSQMGSALSAAIAAFIVILNPNLEMVFLFSIIPYLLGLLNISLYPSSLDRSHPTESIKDLTKEAWRLTIESWNAFKQKSLLKAAFNFSSFSAYYNSVKDYLQTIVLSFSVGVVMVEKFNTDQQNALLIGIAYTLLYLLSSLASKKSAWFQSLFRSEKEALNFSLAFGIAIGAASGIALLLNSPLTAVFLFFGIFIIENIRKPIGVTKITEYSAQQINATVLSVSSQLEAAMAAILAVFFGFIAEQFSVGLALVLSSVLLLIFFPFFLLKK
ncbi:MAG TPA: MFS transporter [Bacteroidales bacterium]|nr:MFS transporter [Bacteroidales bacterium]